MRSCLKTWSTAARRSPNKPCGLTTQGAAAKASHLWTRGADSAVRRARWKPDRRDIFRHEEVGRGVPVGAIEDQHGVRAGRDGGRDLIEMKLHRLGVGARQRQRRADAAGGTNGAEQIGALVTLVCRPARTRSPSRPLPHQAVLLADAGPILEPNLDRRSLRQVGQMDVQDFGEVF
jgi:hypothetical protein